METTNLNIIPRKGETRKLLREEARFFIAASGIKPPVGFDTLKEQAGKLLQKLGLDDSFLEYAMVVTANQIWSKVVSATPYERRLLLLPQCLRDIINCHGEFDEMGMVCAGCNNCGINGILEEAESLGYTTLVADGTSVAVRLIEEGSIDAVIGVGCLAALRQSFKPVNHMAVPAIALPLLVDGCESTSVDYTWLREEIGQIRHDPEVIPLSVSSLKKQVGEYFSPASLEKFFPVGTETGRLARNVVETGGQRMRPLLLVLACMSYNQQADEDMCATLAIIIECFHKASLVHDDIEDDSDTRYGIPTLHVSEGVPAAINAGDYLIGKGYELLSGLKCEPAVVAGCLVLVSGSHVKITEGQGADIKLSRRITACTSEELINIYRHKTGEAVKVSLLLGAVAGNAPAGELQHLGRFAEWFGIAYQIRDDLTEYREVQEPDNPMNYPFLLTLLQEETAVEMSSLKELMNRHNGQLRKKIEEHGIRAKAEDFLRDCISNCYAELEKLQNFRMRLSLFRVTGKVFKDYQV